ncbi:hypothetical protein C0991_009758 [Blastosporella zonata]|nr:hypothetical protein C0991_009758 [Blastosporella zonata]
MSASKENGSVSKEVKDLLKAFIDLQMDSKSLFSAMQDLGFFCALPIDPQRTHMECKPMYKSQ